MGLPGSQGEAGMKILLTGASGFIGTHCATYLRNQGHQVTATDLRPTGSAQPLDITDAEAVATLFHRSRPEVVVHLAALASVPACESSPAECWNINIQGTVHVARVAKEVGARVVFLSTAAVYGIPSLLPTPISAGIAPINLYAISKAAGEGALRGYAPDHVTLRLFNIYGEGCSRSYVIPDLIRKLRASRGEVLLQGTGDESRDFLYISDLLDLLSRAIRAPAGSVFNAGSGTTISVRELAHKVSELAGLGNTVFRFSGPRAGDFPINFANISPGNVPAGWRPTVPLEEGIRRMLREENGAP